MNLTRAEGRYSITFIGGLTMLLAFCPVTRRQAGFSMGVCDVEAQTCTAGFVSYQGCLKALKAAREAPQPSAPKSRSSLIFGVPFQVIVETKHERVIGGAFSPPEPDASQRALDATGQGPQRRAALRNSL